MIFIKLVHDWDENATVLGYGTKDRKCWYNKDNWSNKYKAEYKFHDEFDTQIISIHSTEEDAIKWLEAQVAKYPDNHTKEDLGGGIPMKNVKSLIQSNSGDWMD